MQWHHDTPNTIRALGYFTHPTVGAGLPSDETWFRFCSMACLVEAVDMELVPESVDYDYESDVRPTAAWCHVCHCYLAVRDSDDYYA
jgi:hypothetical protein